MKRDAPERDKATALRALGSSGQRYDATAATFG